MRIVGGRLKSRRLATPAGSATRPTTERVRESLFNILESRYRDRLVGGRVGDLYAGTGALGIEALSRGAAHATFIERSPAAFRLLEGNISALGLKEVSTLIRGDALQALPRLEPMDIIFLDPPYGGEMASEALARITTIGCIAPSGVIVLESATSDLINVPEVMEIFLEKRYGSTLLSFLGLTGPAT